MCPISGYISQHCHDFIHQNTKLTIFCFLCTRLNFIDLRHLQGATVHYGCKLDGRSQCWQSWSYRDSGRQNGSQEVTRGSRYLFLGSGHNDLQSLDCSLVSRTLVVKGHQQLLLERLSSQMLLSLYGVRPWTGEFTEQSVPCPWPKTPGIGSSTAVTLYIFTLGISQNGPNPSSSSSCMK